MKLRIKIIGLAIAILCLNFFIPNHSWASLTSSPTINIQLNLINSSTPPFANLISDQATVTQGNSFNLTWATNNVTSCTASSSPLDPQWNGSKNYLGGIQTLSSASLNLATYTYFLNCSNPFASTTTSTLVTIQSQPAPPLSTSTPSSSSGGGGGGGGGGGAVALPPTTVVIKGLAYPNAVITLLKDAQVVNLKQADENSAFEFDLSNITPGTYTLGLWAIDTYGIKSITFNFTTPVLAYSQTMISSIVLPPTIWQDKVQAAANSKINFYGSAFPQSKITITISSDQQLKLTANANNAGQWQYSLNAGILNFGQHTLMALATLPDGSMSAQSGASEFTVGSRNLYTASPVRNILVVKGDLDGDGKVNLIDFSIMAYWYNRPNPPLYIDLDGDGKVDLKDSSILAYYWTG